MDSTPELKLLMKIKVDIWKVIVFKRENLLKHISNKGSSTLAGNTSEDTRSGVGTKKRTFIAPAFEALNLWSPGEGTGLFTGRQAFDLQRNGLTCFESNRHKMRDAIINIH